MFNKPPTIGMLFKVYGVLCHIIKIHPAGTIDVVSLDGTKAYRITGLSF